MYPRSHGGPESGNYSQLSAGWGILRAPAPAARGYGGRETNKQCLFIKQGIRAHDLAPRVGKPLASVSRGGGEGRAPVRLGSGEQGIRQV